MFRNVFYNTKTSEIHLWDTIKGVRNYTSFKWIPYVFVKTNEEDEAISDIYGNLVSKKNFRTYYEYYDYCNKGISVLENKVRPEIAFLVDYYHSISDDEIETPDLIIYSIDIEVNANEGFPKPELALDPIVLINVTSNKGDSISFGLKPYNGECKEFKYIYCKDEKILLASFFKWINKIDFDVITGWNIENFDFPYLYNRCKNLFGDDDGKNLFSKISPISISRVWQSKKDNSLNIDFAGRSHLDYMKVYKWYAPEKLPSYSLQYVSMFEIEKGKLDYSQYNDLKTLYNENWNLYTEYNYIDNKRIIQLEKKLKYIKELIQSTSLLTKTPMKYYSTQTSLIEGAMLTYLRRKNLCAPHFYGGTEMEYKGAKVKNPIPGLYNWVFSIDITSSYPTAIITLNMSLETFYGKIVKINDDFDIRKYIGTDEEEKKLELFENSIMKYTSQRKFPKFNMITDKGESVVSDKKLNSFNKALEKGLLCIAPQGSIFIANKEGCFSNMVKHFFLKRQEIKNQMNNLKDQNGNKDRIDQLNALQKSLKVMINAAYGATAVPYSRYFNPYISEAITSCGRQAFLAGEKYTNEILNNPSEELIDIFNEIGRI